MANIKRYKKGVRTKLSDNFSSTEFDCNCHDPECQWTYIDVDHVEKLQKIRTELKKPIHINSAYRCPKHNEDIGSASNSRHVAGDATDIVISGLTSDEVADMCEDKFDGLGRYNTFTHVDSRGYKSRWDFRKK